MRWAVFGIVAIIALVWDTGPGEVLRIDKVWGVRPSLCGVLAVFVTLSAPRAAALWSCFILGLLLDLSNPTMIAGNRVFHLIGPYTLGYAAAGWVVIQGRTMVFRRRSLTMGVMTLLFLLVAQGVVVMLYVIRSWYPAGPDLWTETTVLGELARRFLIALYSGVFAIPIGWLLLRTMGLWDFQTVTHRPPVMR